MRCASVPAKKTPTPSDLPCHTPIFSGVRHEFVSTPQRGQKSRQQFGACRGSGRAVRWCRLCRRRPCPACRQGRYRLDAGLLRPGADDVDPRPRPVLRWPGAHQEHAVGIDAGVHGGVDGWHHLGCLWLFAGICRWRCLEFLDRRPVEAVLEYCAREKSHHRCGVADILQWRLYTGTGLYGLPDDICDDHPGPDRRRFC